MPLAPVDWPLAEFPVSSLRWRLEQGLVAAPRSLAGPPSVGSLSGGGWWTAELRGSLLETPEEFEAWWALEAEAEGGLGRFTVPFLAPEFAGGAPRSILTSEPAALRATQLHLDTQAGAPPVAGQHFSFFHGGAWRLYRIKRVLSVVGSARVVAVQPPLRAAIGDGAGAEFANPRCLMQAVDDPAWTPEVLGDWSARPAALFVENFDPT